MEKEDIKKPLIFESHAHYDDEKFDEDREGLLASMQGKGIGTIINIGTSMETTKRSVELAHQYPFIYATIGVHPDEIDCLNDEAISQLYAYASDERVAAMGEIGLDYYWEKDAERQKMQRHWFCRQLDIAKDENLPVVVHSREAAGDTMDIMRGAAKEGISAVIHCYSYSPEQAEEYVSLGYYIGVGGVVTFKNGKKLKETVRRIPLERILLETDCPYLAPEPFRGKRNDSTLLPYVVREIASLKGINEEEVIAVTRQNGERFYRIPEKRAV